MDAGNVPSTQLQIEIHSGLPAQLLAQIDASRHDHDDQIGIKFYDGGHVLGRACILGHRISDGGLPTVAGLLHPKYTFLILDGAMEYWLEQAWFAALWREAGVADPTREEARRLCVAGAPQRGRPRSQCESLARREVPILSLSCAGGALISKVILL